MTSHQWAANGPDDSTSGTDSVPAFLELTPGDFEPTEACSADQLRAAADSRLLQARALMDEARCLYSLAETR
ncbi:hypothetical protein ACIRPX_05120 [Streptomyces sp. NPDC101225]|uniref:hypothetical protein n=1 Tax=Streptomyces sp. NPDC101225 TaxID=3366135 RepID=UPI0037FA13A4